MSINEGHQVLDEIDDASTALKQSRSPENITSTYGLKTPGDLLEKLKQDASACVTWQGEPSVQRKYDRPIRRVPCRRVRYSAEIAP